MLRHEFRPGRAVAGLVMLTLAAGYAADAAGAWHVPWTFFAPSSSAASGLRPR